MDIHLLAPVLESVIFGLVVSGLYYLIVGAPSPYPWRAWLGGAWVLACLCYIVLFGVIHA